MDRLARAMESVAEAIPEPVRSSQVQVGGGTTEVSPEADSLVSVKPSRDVVGAPVPADEQRSLDQEVGVAATQQQEATVVVEPCLGCSDQAVPQTEALPHSEPSMDDTHEIKPVERTSSEPAIEDDGPIDLSEKESEAVANVQVSPRQSEPIESVSAPTVAPTPPATRKSKYESRDVFFPPASTETTLVECFVIVGLRDETSNSSQVLFCYPPEIDSKRLASIMQFCVPERSSARTVRRSRSGSSLNQLIHGSDQAFSRRHVFCMGAPDGGFEWGSVLVKEELLSMLPSVLGPEQVAKAAAAVIDKPELGAADRAYCLVSRYPLFSVHFDLLLSLLSHERALRLISTSGGESPVLEELNRAMKLRIDRSVNQQIRLDLYSRQALFELPFLDLADSLDGYFSDMVAQQTLPALLQRLSLPNVLRIFNAVMLCKQVLFRSRFCGVASAVALAASLLIRPLRWEGLLVPVLPQAMKTALMAPVPFIIGIAGHVLNEELNLDGVVVDVDVDKVYVLAKYPSLPASAQLANNLEPIANKFFPRQSVTPRPPFDPSPDQKMASLQAFACFTAYGKWLIGKLIIHLDSDASIVTPKALKESFLHTVTSGNRAFVFAWLNTQHMSVFLEQELAKRNA